MLLITGVTWSDVSELRDLEQWDSECRSRKKEARVKEINNKTRKKKEKEREHQKGPKRRKIC